MKYGKIRKAYLTILTIITVICILLGLGMRGNLMFGNTKLFYFGSSKLRIEEQSLEAFDSLDLDLDIGDVTIISGTKYSISVECSEDIFPEIENEAGQLSVSQSREGIIFGFGNSYECSVTIEVPGDAYLDRVDLSMDLGDLSIKNVNAEYLTADMDLGDISAVNTNINTGSFTMDLGEISFQGTAQRIDADSDLGDIEIDVVNADECKLDLNTSLGEVSVNGNNYGSNYHN